MTSAVIQTVARASVQAVSPRVCSPRQPRVSFWMIMNLHFRTPSYVLCYMG